MAAGSCCKPITPEGRYVVSDGKGFDREGTVLHRTRDTWRPEEPWFFWDEPRFPWTVGELQAEGYALQPVVIGTHNRKGD